MLQKLISICTLAVFMTACDFVKSGSNNNDTSGSNTEASTEFVNTNEAYNTYTEQNQNTEEEPEVYIDWDRINSEYTEEITVTENTYNTPSYSDNTSYQSKYSNFEPSSNDCEGVVVYEGRGDYYIIETQLGYTVLETYGGYLWEDDYVRGELNSYNWHFILDTTRDNEVRVYIEDYMLSAERALEWLGSHNKLKYSDQEVYDREND